MVENREQFGAGQHFKGQHSPSVAMGFVLLDITKQLCRAAV